MSACSPTPEQTADGPERPAGLESGLVVRIVDGDTIDLAVGLETITVRLLGTNSPEKGECFYDEATDYLVRTVDGAKIGLDGQAQDQFGRTLAYLWNEDEWVNLTMVDKGFAIATTPEGEQPYGAALLEAESAAVADAVGLWGPEVCGASGAIPTVGLDVSAFDAPGPDDKNLSGEVVTISNDSTSPVDLSGWVIRDESSVNRYRFAPGSSLLPGASLQMRSDASGWKPGNSPVWNNDGDMALLLDEHGRVVSRHRYP